MNNYSYRFDSYKNVSLMRIEAARRIANVIYQLGPSHLFDSEENILNWDRELRNMVEDCLESLNQGIPWPPRYHILIISSVNHILLDKPEMKYANLVGEYCKLYNFVLIDFLCSHISDNSHFACVILGEQINLKYRCLGVPVEEWHEYKKLPHYKGE